MTLFLLFIAALVASPLSAGPINFAKSEYASYMRRVTGRDAPAAEFLLDSTLDTLHDEYRIVSTNGHVAFIGANGRAVQYAVYDFLSRRADAAGSGMATSSPGASWLTSRGWTCARSRSSSIAPSAISRTEA